jgi:chromosome partitioning protein
VLRESQAYVRCIEKGLSVFDLPAAHVQTDLAQWEPILEWLHPILQPAQRAADDMQRTPPRMHAATGSAVNGAATREPAQRALEPISPERQRAPSPSTQTAIAVSTLRRLRDALPIPRFLQRTP